MSKRERGTVPPPAGTQSGRPGSLTTHFIREAYIRYRGRPRKLDEPVTAPQHAVEFGRRVVQDHAREHCLALYLDASQRAIAYSIIAVGTARSVDMHPREIFQPAILAGATGIVLLHNHPSGDTQPSLADFAVAKHLVEDGRMLRIYVHDSIVWTHHSRDYTSLRELEPKMFPKPTAFKPEP